MVNSRKDAMHYIKALLQEELLRNTRHEELEQTQAELDKVKKENARLWQYIDKISEQGYENSGKPISKVKGRQQRRKIHELKTYVEKALWFAETFGLKLSSVEFADDDGRLHTIEYHNNIEGKKCSYKDLPDEEKVKVQQVLFITDKFCIGEAAYHELTMTNNGGEGLPRSYLVKQCKKNLNDLCHTKRTPGENEGAQLDVLSELRSTIADQASCFYTVIIGVWLGMVSQVWSIWGPASH